MFGGHGVEAVARVTAERGRVKFLLPTEERRGGTRAGPPLRAAVPAFTLSATQGGEPEVGEPALEAQRGATSIVSEGAVQHGFAARGRCRSARRSDQHAR